MEEVSRSPSAWPARVSAPLVLHASYAYCRQLARKTARNFYYSFWSLPAPQFRAMCALYAFMRISDDLGDDPDRSLSARTAALHSWRGALLAALDGEPTSHPIFPALCDTVRTYQLSVPELLAVLEGIEQDLTPFQITTFADLERYCYHVAGAVGLNCVRIWGYTGAAPTDPAVACGLAFQLTNILRDLREDAQLGRIYLPTEDLERFGYSATELQQGVRNTAFRDLMAFEVTRARECYAQAEALQGVLSPAGRPIFSTMHRLYRDLLDEIERRDFDVYTQRVELHRWHKLRLAARGLWQQQQVAWGWRR